MQIIGLTGLARSGKDTAADYLEEKHGFTKIVLSSFLAKELKKKNIKPTKTNLLLLGNELREKFGQGIVGELAAKEILKKKHEKVVVVGFRSVEETFPIKKIYPNFKLISLTAEKDVRFMRRDELDPNSEKKFFERDKIDIEKKGLLNVIKSADFNVNNSNSLKKLYNSLELLIQKI